jgi:UDP-2-acetamido-3-amino-2,3-dideoxy-glucuronate N-acetyltransferase
VNDRVALRGAHGALLPGMCLRGNAYVHERALVEGQAQVGAHTLVWAFAAVMNGAVIGEDSILGQSVHVSAGAVIGNHCSIQNGAQIFHGVTLEDEVFIAPHVVFTNVKIPRAFVDRKDEFKPTLVKRGASIGANATIVCGVTIGEYAMVGAGAVVTSDVAAHALVYGNPAQPHGAVCRCGVKLEATRHNKHDTRVDYKPCVCGAEYEFVLDRGEDSEIRAKAPTP